MFTTGNEIVDKVGTINIEGNVIPHAWYQHFKMPNGKPDLNAMIILSEIVYWYRPSTVRDETTGQVTGIKKKFKADLLQRSYESFAIQFGLTKRQVKEAIDRLCVHGVIWKEFRTVNVNIKLNNVLFIGINTDVLCSVSVLQAHTLKSNTLLRSNVTPSNDKTSNPPTLDSETNTDITTGTTTGISTDTGEKQQQQKKPKKAKPKLEKPNELNQQLWDDLISLRKQKKQPLTYSAWHDAKYNLAQLQLGVSQGHTMDEMVGVWLLRGWQGFKFEWYLNHVAKENQSQNTQGNHNAINQPTFGKSAAELYAEKLTNQLAEQHQNEFAPVAPVAPTGVGYDYQ